MIQVYTSRDQSRENEPSGQWWGEVVSNVGMDDEYSLYSTGFHQTEIAAYDDAHQWLRINGRRIAK